MGARFRPAVMLLAVLVFWRTSTMGVLAAQEESGPAFVGLGVGQGRGMSPGAGAIVENRKDVSAPLVLSGDSLTGWNIPAVVRLDRDGLPASSPEGDQAGSSEIPTWSLRLPAGTAELPGMDLTAQPLLLLETWDRPYPAVGNLIPTASAIAEVVAEASEKPSPEAGGGEAAAPEASPPRREIPRSILLERILPHAVILAVLFRYDKSILTGWESFRTQDRVQRWGKRLSALGEGFVDLSICGALHLFGNEKSRETARLGAAAVIHAGINVQLLKHVFGSSFPGVDNNVNMWVGPTFKQGYEAFPSGHTASVFALAHVLARQYPRKSAWFYIVAGLVGISRVTEGTHWPSDVYGGALLGIWTANQTLKGRPSLLRIKVTF